MIWRVLFVGSCPNNLLTLYSTFNSWSNIHHVNLVTANDTKLHCMLEQLNFHSSNACGSRVQVLHTSMWSGIMYMSRYCSVLSLWFTKAAYQWSLVLSLITARCIHTYSASSWKKEFSILNFCCFRGDFSPQIFLTPLNFDLVVLFACAHPLFCTGGEGDYVCECIHCEYRFSVIAPKTCTASWSERWKSVCTNDSHFR